MERTHKCDSKNIVKKEDTMQVSQVGDKVSKQRGYLLSVYTFYFLKICLCRIQQCKEIFFFEVGCARSAVCSGAKMDGQENGMGTCQT